MYEALDVEKSFYPKDTSAEQHCCDKAFNDDKASTDLLSFCTRAVAAACILFYFSCKTSCLSPPSCNMHASSTYDIVVQSFPSLQPHPSRPGKKELFVDMHPLICTYTDYRRLRVYFFLSRL